MEPEALEIKDLRGNLLRYPTRHIIKDPRVTSIHFGAMEAKSIPQATEFWTRLMVT
jgi:hypothetical protein